jgi:hypothetical protein
VATDVKEPQKPTRFYAVRRRFYEGLLLFIVVAGLPIVGVPFLRQRLSERVIAFKLAFSNDIIPARAGVGENKQPFPAEFERPEPLLPNPPQLPSSEGSITAIFPANAPPRISYSRKKEKKPEIVASTEDSSEEPPAASDEGPKYQTGQIEQSAYNLLIQSNPTVAKMVQGSDPSLHFVSWDAAGRGDDIYWVRLKFKAEGIPDVEYIWQVKLQSNEVKPLSHNAREIF